MDSEQLKDRTKKLAVKIIRLTDSIPRSDTTTILNKQIIRSATSVAANYRSACRARSKADFVNKLGIVEEEADETLFWLDMLIDCGKIQKDKISSLYTEASELVAIFSASHKTAKLNHRR